MKKGKVVEIVKVFFVGLLVVIGTFPSNDWSISTGGDPSLAWVYNYLFENNLLLGKDIVFPHGPLAFFMYPLAPNILLVTFFRSALKFLIVFSLYGIIDLEENWKVILVFIIGYFLGITLPFNHLLLASVLFIFLYYYKTEKFYIKAVAILLTSFAFYVRVYVGVVSGTIFIGFLLFFLVRDKNIKGVALDMLIYICGILLIWLCLYGTFHGFLRFLAGMIQLIQDNSSAASIYPQNNWVALSVFILIVLGLPVLNRTKNTFFFASVTFLSLFAAWKHGMAREHGYYVAGFLNYVVIIFIFFLIVENKKRFQNLVITGIAIFLLLSAFEYAVNYSGSKYELYKSNSFFEFVTNFRSLKLRSENKITRNIAIQKLPDPIRDSIGDQTVDCYPWDYTYIPANNLNWQPRIVLHSYAAYTHWLDKKDADHFKSGNAPEFIVFEKFKGFNGTVLNSIDRRYILNDEPNTILSLLSNYQCFFDTAQYFILKKRSENLEYTISNLGNQKTSWGLWAKAPWSGTDLIRAKLTFKKTFLQRTKSFFYKDEQFWIYVKLNNGLIHKYRIVPKNAKDGLWINPYITNISKSHIITEILFTSSNRKILDKDIQIQWEKVHFESDESPIQKMFNVSYGDNSQVVSSKECYFGDTLEKVNPGKMPENSGENILQDQKSFVLKPHTSSPVIHLYLDSLLFDPYRIIGSYWIKGADYAFDNSVILILSVDQGGTNNILWNGSSVDEQFIDNEYWNYVHHIIDFDHMKQGCRLNAYIRNNGDKEVMVEKLCLTIIHAE